MPGILGGRDEHRKDEFTLKIHDFGGRLRFTGSVERRRARFMVVEDT